MRPKAARRLLGALTTTLFILIPTLSAPAAPLLVPDDLGVLEGETSSAAAFINRNGRVTGNSGTRVFSWTEHLRLDNR